MKRPIGVKPSHAPVRCAECGVVVQKHHYERHAKTFAHVARARRRAEGKRDAEPT